MGRDLNSANLHVCLVCDFTNVHFKRWVRDLESLGHQVTVLSIKGETNDSSSHVDMMHIPRVQIPGFKALKDVVKMIIRVKLALAYSKKLAKIKPDIVHAHFLSDAGWIGMWLNFHPFVVTSHGSDVLVHPIEKKYYKWGNRLVLKKADDVVIVASHLRGAVKTLGCKDEKIRLIANYADSQFLINSDELNNKFSDIEKQPVIISARKLNKIYNIETLIRAVSIVIKKFSGLKVLILDTGDEYQRLVDLTHALNLEQTIQFIGKVPHDQLNHYFFRSHLYISTALSDGTSVATLEGISGGAIPILTDIPGNRSFMEMGIKGYLFQPEDHVALAAAISNALSYKEKCLQESKHNVEVVSQKYSRSVVMEEMEQVYYHALKRCHQ